MEKKIKAPFSEDQVKALNDYQSSGRFHPLTCCSPYEIEECNRRLDKGETYQERQGILKATKDGWVCPCGKYMQDWAHSFMLKKEE